MALKESGEEEKAQRIVRITDVAEEPLETLLPIDGYEDMPLVPLETAVEGLVHLFPRIQTYVHVAKERCKTPADGLTQDESASIMLYTMGWKPRDQCLYVVLNIILRSKDREQLTPWLLYLKLLLTALFRLPSVTRTVFRGVKLNLMEKYTKGNTTIWWSFSSCTIAMSVLKSEVFLGNKDTRTMFTIECLNGKNIRNHSYYQSEDEILLLPATHFQVMDCLDQGDLKLVHLQEILPRFPLIQPAAISLTPTITISNTPHINSNTKWKQHGSTVAGGNGHGHQLNQFSQPYDIYLDDDNQCIYIADYNNHRIVEWRFETKTSQTVAGGNGQGNRMNQLNEPTDMILDKKSDSLIICDAENRRLVRWPRQNGTHGKTIIYDIACSGVIMDNNGDLYISDYKKHEVRRWRIGESEGIIVAGGNGKGSGLNQLSLPTDIFVDQDHSVYVLDRNNHRVMKWIKGAKEGIIVAGEKGEGSSLAQLSHPRRVIVDQLGDLYVSDSYNHRIMQWSKGSKEGRIIVGGNGKGQQPDQLSRPMGIAFDRKGDLYVLDCDNNRIQKFDIDLN